MNNSIYSEKTQNFSTTDTSMFCPMYMNEKITPEKYCCNYFFLENKFSIAITFHEKYNFL